MKIIVSRTDRAGDLILTTPVFRELRTNFPDAELTAHVRQYTAPLLNGCTEIDKILIDDEYKDFIQLAKAFKNEKPDIIIIVHPAARVINAAFFADIPLRIGRASNLWQFMLNDRKHQKRSRNEQHEFRYNLDLLKGLVKRIDYAKPALKPSARDIEIGGNYLTKAGLNDKKPVIIHPGHGGSARNLPTSAYVRLASILVEAGFSVIISLGPAEENLKNLFLKGCKHPLAFLTGIPDLGILAGAYSRCRAFIGGSTGPMHLAAALKLPVVAFFPPVPAMTPVRWGPVCEKKLVLMPEVKNCKADCDSCSFKGCMSTIDIHEAANWLKKSLTL
ncbi:MAG: glycosyltransferase family 9 protein [Candidatus Rifleibacteriota bacterium]